jgi:hypothetical protein
MSKRTVIVYWLIPARDERELFRDIIRILYKEFGASNFEPHLTLFAADENQQFSGKILSQMRFAPLRLRLRDVGFSSQFRKTLFVRFARNTRLDKMIVDLARATKSRPKPMRDPHLSFLYNNIGLATKKELAAAIKLPFREVLFDSIAAVRCPSPTRTATDVRAWRMLARRKLDR